MHSYVFFFGWVWMSLALSVHGQCSSMRIRKPYEEFTITQRTILNNALWRMKRNGFLDRITRKHRSGMKWHGTAFFMVMHRALVKDFEDELIRLAPSLPGLPFWNELNDVVHPQRAAVFGPTALGPLRDGNLGPPFVGLLDDRQRHITRKPRNRTSGILWLPQNQVLARALLQFRTYTDMSRALEMSPHNQMHAYIGGHMGNPTISPSDPIVAYSPFCIARSLRCAAARPREQQHSLPRLTHFWLHHAYVDFLWALWQSLSPAHVEELTLRNGTQIDPNAPAVLHESQYTNLDVTRYLRLCYRYELPRTHLRRRTPTADCPTVFRKIQPMCEGEVRGLMPNLPICQWRGVENMLNSIVDKLNTEVESGQTAAKLDTIESLFLQFESQPALEKDDYKYSRIPAIQKLREQNFPCSSTSNRSMILDAP